MHAPEAEINIMAELKSSTELLHKRVEALMPFFKPGFTLQQYAALLSGFLGLVDPLERRLASLAGLPELGIDMAQRRRAHLLRDDLRALGYSQPAINSIPQAGRLPDLRDPYEGLGCLYVLEGSTLGGQLIARELARCFHIDQSSGASFFLSYGPTVGDMWKQYCSVVRSSIKSPVQRESTLRAAEHTFTCFEFWLQKEVLSAQ